MHRRDFAGLAVGALAGTAGCIGFLTGSEPLTLAATRATVSDDARAAAGYEAVGVEKQWINQSVTAAGQERQVNAANWAALYDRSVSVGSLVKQRAAVFAAFATPKAEVVGKPFNPVAEMSNRELVAQVQSRYQNLRVGNEVDAWTVSTLGTEADVSTFDGSASFNGVEIPVRVHVTKIDHGDDFIVALGVHPKALDGEREKVRRLLSGLQHG